MTSARNHLQRLSGNREHVLCSAFRVLRSVFHVPRSVLLNKPQSIRINLKDTSYALSVY